MECFICNKPLVGRYFIDGWNHNICESHLDNDAVNCSSCTGFTKKDNILPDGRILCNVCMGMALKPDYPIETIKNSVINALNRVGFNDLRTEDISIEIVSAQRLANIRRGLVNLQNKGLTLSKTKTTTSFGLLTGKHINQTFQHTIYVLTHLTKIEFAGTLAHEMLHAWQVQNGIKMSPKMTEGLCNMGSYLMYDTLANSLTKILLKSIHESPDPVYGGGFREVFAIYEECGWTELINKVRENRL